ncbi:MAG: transporter substrate-binding domain-containing protein, partial [Pseudomonadota bacterium]
MNNLKKIQIAFFKAWAFILIAICLLLPQNVLANKQVADTNTLLKQTQPLLISGNKNYAPYSYINSTGEPRGLLIDLWNEWAKVTNTKIKFILKDWGETVKAIKNKDVDIHSGMYIKPDKLFNTNHIHKTNVSLFVKKSENLNLNLSFNKKRVGIINSFFGQMLKKDYPNFDIIVFHNYEQIFQAIEQQKIDLFFGSTLPILSASTTTSIDALLKFISISSHLLHSLQQERGASSGYISAEGKKFNQKLTQLIATNNQKSDELNNYLNKNNRLLNQYLNSFELQKINTLQNDLKKVREEVKTLKIDYSQVYARYTRIISVLLLTIADTSEKINNQSLEDKLYIYSTLLMYKESIGQKRAALSGLFASKEIAHKIFEYYISSDTQEKIYLKTFLHNIDWNTEVFFHKTIDKKIVNDVENYEKLAYQKLQGQEINIQPEKWFEVVSDKIDRIQVVENYLFQDIQSTYAEIRNKQLLNPANTNPYEIIATKNTYYFNLNPMLYDSSLINKINKGFNKISIDKLRQIENKWIDSESSFYKNSPFTSEELNWIKENIVKVGIESWAPIIFMENGSPKGLAGDMLKLLAEKTGLNLQFINKPWEDLILDLKDKKVDLLPDSYYSKERTKFGLFSKPYFTMREQIYVTNNNTQIQSFDDLSYKSIAILKGYAITASIKKQYPDIHIIETDNLIQSVKLVLSGQVDALLESQLTSEYFFQEQGIFDLKGIPQFALDTNKLHFLSRIDQPILHSIVQKGLNAISNQEKTKIIEKWTKILQSAQQLDYKHLNKEISKFSFIELLQFEEILFAAFICLLFAYFIYQNYSQSRFLNIRFNHFILLIVGMELFMIIFIIYELIALDRLENSLAVVHKDKFEMIKVVNKLRQSSDNLTHYARNYVVTNNSKYKQHYYNILAIRNGSKPRPEDYNAIYWLLAKELRMQQHPDGEKISLNQLMEKLPFSQAELKLLKTSEDNSNDLVNLEVKAFKSMQENNQPLAIQLLHSQAYEQAKIKIMYPINGMLNKIDKRSDLKIKLLEQYISNAYKVMMIASLFFILGNFLVYLMLVKKIREPLNYLLDTIKKFESGSKHIAEKIFYHDEIGKLSRAFFVMQKVITKQTADLLKQLKFVQKAEKRQDKYIAMLDQKNVKMEKILKSQIESETIVRSIIDNSQEGIILINSENIIISWNKAAETIFGYTEDEVKDQLVQIIIPDDMKKAHSDGIIRYLNTKEPKILGKGLVEVTGLHKNGHLIPIEFTLSTFEINSQAVFSASIRDITERKQSENAIIQAEEQIRLLLTSVGEGIFGVGQDGLVNFINPAALEMLQYEEDEILGQKIHPIIHHTHTDGRTYPIEECPMYHAFSEGKISHIDNEVLWRKDGTNFPVDYKARPVISNNEISGSVVTFSDITKRKQAVAEIKEMSILSDKARKVAEEATRAKSDFL